jgi:hypothetical protein
VNPTLDTLIGALYGHLACHPLSPPVTISFDLVRPEISMQVTVADSVTRLRELLAWGHSLDRVTVSGWHTRDNTLHLTITGHTISGVPVKVYGGVPHVDVADVIVVEVDDSVTLTLDELATLLASLADTQAGAA